MAEPNPPMEDGPNPYRDTTDGSAPGSAPGNAPGTGPRNAPDGDPTAPPTSPDEPLTAESFGELTSDEKTMGMLAHLLGIFTGFLGPLVIWVLKKDDSRWVYLNGKEALNFQLTLLAVYVLSVVLAYWKASPVMCMGVVMFIGAFICSIVFGIMATMAANDGKLYRYPLCIRMIT